MRGKNITKAERKKIREYAAAGMTHQKIAQPLGRSQSVVSKNIRAMRIRLKIQDTAKSITATKADASDLVYAQKAIKFLAHLGRSL